MYLSSSLVIESASEEELGRGNWVKEALPSLCEAGFSQVDTGSTLHE